MVDPAFDDPAAVIELVHRHAPYRQIIGLYDNKANTYDQSRIDPWFRGFWAGNEQTNVSGAEAIFHNPRFVAAAKESFDAEIVRPLSLMININGPMPEGKRHVDAPWFRGAVDPSMSALRICMGMSKLFRRWEVLVASAIAWFHTGTGGGLDYWPDGPDQPFCTIAPPMWNIALVSDNEYMFHRVGAVGDPADFVPPGVVGLSTTLTRTPDGWELKNVRTPQRVAFTDSQVRISILWKAFVFDNAEAAHAFDSHSDDLTLDIIVDIFRADLAERGISTRAPSDPLRDAAWNELLAHHYPSPYFSS